jgi:hypothetical protein
MKLIQFGELGECKTLEIIKKNGAIWCSTSSWEYKSGEQLRKEH